MSNTEFIAFVRRPRLLDNTDGIQLYENSAEDTDSKTSYMLNCQVLGSLILTLISLSCYYSTSYTEVALNFARYGSAGAAVWTALEYIFHRFVLHKELQLDPEAKADPEHLADIFSKHLQHHVFMNQKYRIVQAF
jgi:hypothetical protein